MGERPTVPRGRHAPPLPVRQSRQRARLLEAAAAVFARTGYLDAGAESVAREAGMSKATFYEHFANKEECLLTLFDVAVARISAGVLGASTSTAKPTTARGGAEVKARIRSFLEIVADHPNEAQALLVEMVGAGPRAAGRRDAAMRAAAWQLYSANPREGEGYPTPYDAFAVIGAAVELVSRQLRRGEPETLADLQPVLERLIFGLLRKV